MKTFDKWKGTDGILQVDIGYDVNERRGYEEYSIQVFTNKKTVATVYGESIEETDANAKLIASSKESIELLTKTHKTLLKTLKSLKNNSSTLDEYKSLVNLVEDIENLINETL